MSGPSHPSSSRLSDARALSLSPIRKVSTATQFRRLETPLQPPLDLQRRHLRVEQRPQLRRRLEASLSRDIENELAVRSVESGLPQPVLRAVYMRETREATCGGNKLCASAFARVDEFIVYALTRDTSCGRDRDLAPTASVSWSQRSVVLRTPPDVLGDQCPTTLTTTSPSR